MYSKILTTLLSTFSFFISNGIAQNTPICFFENFNNPQSGWVLSNGSQIRNYNNPAIGCGNDIGIVTPNVSGNNNVIIKTPTNISNGNDFLKISFDIFKLSSNMNCSSWSNFDCPTNLEISMITDNNTIAGITNLIIPQIGPGFNPKITTVINIDGALPSGTSFRLMIKLKSNNAGISCTQSNSKYVLDNIELCQGTNVSFIDATDDNLCYLANESDEFVGDVSLNDFSNSGSEVTYSLANGPFGLNSSSTGGATITFNADGTFILTRTDGLESIFDFTYKMTDNSTGLTDLASVRVCFTDGGPLPLTLVNFGCTRNNKTAELVWNTSIESNIIRFEIQRKIGARFETVGTVLAKNSQIGSSYAFNEYNNASGITEYRLKIVENNNINRYSSIKALKGIKGADEMEVYPMPSKGNVTIRMNEINNRASVEIINLSGSVVKKISNNSSNLFEFNDLQNGFYIIKYTNNLTGNVITKKLMVTK